jgi:para-aminobenzoate synthetase component II
MQLNIALIDNYDSFTNNLKHLLLGVGPNLVSVIPYLEFRKLDLSLFDLIVISPGPGTPSDYPAYERLLTHPGPVLGICLGMQVMNVLLGGRVGPLSTCIHGKTSPMDFRGERPEVARYHSLFCEMVPGSFEITGTCEHVPMIIEGSDRAWVGYQFHPESFMTTSGEELIRYAIDQVMAS